MKNAGKACNNRLYRHIRTFEKIVKNYFVICSTLTVIGAINWGLIGFFNLNLVALLFGSMSLLSRIIYGLVGLCGLYLLSFYGLVEQDRTSS